MEIGIDSFIATGAYEGALNPQQNIEAIEALLSKIEHADKMGLHVFGLGEHHRKEFLDGLRLLFWLLLPLALKTLSLPVQ